MIFKPRFPSRPPAGRIDMVIYFGAGVPMADWRFYACDFDTGEIVFLDPADFGGFPPGGPAGGDLSGTYPDPSIATVPDGALSGNVPLMTGGVLPVASGANLTDLPLPAALHFGNAVFDSVGRAVLFTTSSFSGSVLVTAQSAVQGYLFVTQESDDLVCYASGGVAAADSNCYWLWIEG